MQTAWLARITPKLFAAIGGLAILAAVLGRDPAQAGIASPTSLTLAGVLTVANRERIVERSFVVPHGSVQLDLDVALTSNGRPEGVDFGLRGPDGFRGWTTARREHVHINRVSASYGYLPGAVEPGEWHVMLDGSELRDGSEVGYEVTVRLSGRIELPRPTLRGGPGWFAGDLHVHSGHSDGYGASRFGQYGPVAVRDLTALARQAHLDFLAVTDHNTVSHWLDIDREQAGDERLLLLHGREITTARGHFNAIGERTFTDFRLGPTRPMASLLEDVGRDGAFLSINHPSPTTDGCAGCGWQGHDLATSGLVAGIEMVNGSEHPPPGQLPVWTMWADALNRGARLVAVGGSDVHEPFGDGSVIGRPATVVWASALSENAIVAGLKAGRAFIRMSPGDGFLELTATNGRDRANMGEAIGAGAMTLIARVSGARGQQLTWIRRGREIQSVPIVSSDRSISLSVEAVRGDWFSALVLDEGLPSLISNAIFVGSR